MFLSAFPLLPITLFSLLAIISSTLAFPQKYPRKPNLHFQHRRYPDFTSLSLKKRAAGAATTTVVVSTTTTQFHTVTATDATPLLIINPSTSTSAPQASSTKDAGVAIYLAPPVSSKMPKVCTRTKMSSSAISTSTSKTSQSATTRTSSSTTPTPTADSSERRPMMAAYYPDWAGWTMPPEKVDFDRFDWVDFAFALPMADLSLKFTQDNSEDLLRRLVTSAHAKGKHVKLSIGGWTGSKYFSSAVLNDENRRKFAKNFLDIYDKFGIDGIDIDWEYPGTSGDSGNVVSSKDSENYLSFLKILRNTLPSNAVITAATQVWPFAGPNGMPLSDVSEFAKVFDWILLMNYDVWGSSSTPGPNAPLDNGCRNSTQPLANAVAAVKSWKDAGFPPEKITLGVPSYGYISKSNAQHLTGRADSVVVKNDNGGTTNGQVQFNSLISQGALQKKDGSYVGAGGFVRKWDTCSSTPFLRSASQGQIITYDDPESLGLKGEFAKRAGIKGVNMFDAHGDTASWELVDAVRKGLGLA